MERYEIERPNNQYNDWNVVEEQIVNLNQRIDEAVAGTTSFDKITGEPTDNDKLAQALSEKADKIYVDEEVDIVQDQVNTLNTELQDLSDSVDDRLEDKVDKETGKSLVSDTDIAQITTNKNDITDIKTDVEAIEQSLEEKVDKETGKELIASEKIAQIDTNTDDIEELKNTIQVVQLDELPTPTAQLLGKIIQYTGPTATDAINGYFYQCGYNEDTLQFEWQPKKVMDAAEEGGVDAYTKAETDQLLANKQDRLTAGEGIKITGNVIMQDIIDDTITSPQTTWSSRYLESLFHSLSGLSSIEIVDSRPAQPVNNTLYYVKAYEEGEEPLYEIWFYTNNTWTKFGTTSIDLTNYYTKTEVDTLLTNKQDKLTEGQGISLTNNVATVKIDGTTLSINEAGNIYVKSGGGGGGGGGFEPTEAQLQAMNSGITTNKRTGYDTAVNDVSGLKTRMTTAEGDIDNLETALEDKADKDTTYTKTETDGLLDEKADADTTYTKTEVDTELGKKLDKRTGSGVGVYSHSSDTQGELAVKTTMSSSPSDSNLLTEKGVKDYVDGKDPLSWNYIGILGASSGSTLTIKDDWKDLLVVARVTEGSSVYNLTQVMPKFAFTQGSPTANVCMFGFYWNSNYNASARLGLSGSGDSLKIQVGYTSTNGWVINGYYVYKR